MDFVPYKRKPPTPSPLPPPALFLTDNIKMAEYQTKSNKKYMLFLHYIIFQVLKVLLIKIFKVQPPDLLFIIVFITFYISRYHFSQSFRTSFNIIRKKDFRHKFSFFNRFTQTPSPHPLNGQNMLSRTIVFCQCFLNVDRESIAILCQSKDFEKNQNYQGHSADVYVHKRMNDNKRNQ